MDETGKVRYTILMIYRGGTGKNKTSLFNTKYDADGNLIKESSCTKEAVYAYNAANRMAESHVTEIRDGSRQTPKDTVYAYDSFGKDHLGSVRAVTNQRGSPLYMFDYDVFGQPLQDRPELFGHGFTLHVFRNSCTIR